jgi:hypothetical protein
MNTIIGLILAGSIFAVIGLGLWLFIIVFREKEDDLDSTILLNFLSNKTNGRFLGKELNVIDADSGRKVITFEPKDLLLRGRHKNDKIETEEVIVGKSKYITLPRGTLSRDRNISIALPITPDDLPENIKETELGIALMMMTEMKNLADTEKAIIREGSTRKDAMLKKIGDGEISRDMMSYFEEMIKDYLKAQINPRDNKDKPSLLQGAGNYQHPE